MSQSYMEFVLAMLILKKKAGRKQDHLVCRNSLIILLWKRYISGVTRSFNYSWALKSELLAMPRIWTWMFCVATSDPNQSDINQLANRLRSSRILRSVNRVNRVNRVVWLRWLMVLLMILDPMLFPISREGWDSRSHINVLSNSI